jgi:hypothetical protein
MMDMTRLEVRARVLAGEDGRPDAWGEYIELAKVQVIEADRLWREREMTFPPRVRRMIPDAIDYITGAWSRLLPPPP